MTAPSPGWVLAAAVALAGCTRSWDWAVADPKAAGFDPRALDAAFAEAEGLGFEDSLLVARHGRVVAEAAWNGWAIDDAHDVRSVSKSLLSAMIGIAADRGLLALDDRVTEAFPDVHPADPRVDEITVQHLLEMRGGLPDDHESYFDLTSSDDWIAATLGQTLVADPGTEWHYTTLGTHVLSGVLTVDSGESSLAFAQEALCGPIGIACEVWATDPQGIYFGGNAMQLTPADMARFGFVISRGGLAGGQQVVPSDWVDFVTTEVTHGGWDWGPFTGMGYARLWWTGTLAGRPVVLALGHGGQYILLDPTDDVVVVTTSFYNLDWDPADAQERAVAEVIAGVLRAVVD